MSKRIKLGGTSLEIHRIPSTSTTLDSLPRAPEEENDYAGGNLEESDSELETLTLRNWEEMSSDDEEVMEIQLSPRQYLEQDSPSPTSSDILHRSYWTFEKITPPVFIFTGTQGMLRTTENGEPIEYFRMIADDRLMDHIIKETNMEAQIRLEETERPRARIKAWKDLTREEFEKFLALIYMTGNVKCPDIPYYWKSTKIYNFPTFSSVMARDRFQLLLGTLNFVRNPALWEPDPPDPLYKIRPLMNIFHENMDNVYSPGKELCLGESMLMWWGKMYMTNTRHKFGSKIYSLTEPNGLVLRTVIYDFAKDSRFPAKEFTGKNHADKIVYKLMSDFMGKGHSLYSTRFYNSVPLAKDLLSNMTYLTGALERGREGNPKEVLQLDLPIKGEVVQGFNQDGICVFKWRDKKEVTFVSSEFDGTLKATEKNSQKGKTNEKPSAVIEYNRHTVELEKREHLMSYYPCEGKSLRWHVKLGIHYFHLIMNNSYLLYCTQVKQPIGLIDFRDSVIESLLSASHRVIALSSKEGVKIHLPTKCGNPRTQRKNCRVCTRKKIRKNTPYFCPDCPTQPGLCLECFGEFHNY